MLLQFKINGLLILNPWVFLLFIVILLLNAVKRYPAQSLALRQTSWGEMVERIEFCLFLKEVFISTQIYYYFNPTKPLRRRSKFDCNGYFHVARFAMLT